LVYELYSPTSEEIALVEAETNSEGLKGRNVMAQGAALGSRHPRIHKAL
jgi:hypothetical protein